MIISYGNKLSYMILQMSPYDVLDKTDRYVYSMCCRILNLCPGSIILGTTILKDKNYIYSFSSPWLVLPNTNRHNCILQETLPESFSILNYDYRIGSVCDAVFPKNVDKKSKRTSLAKLFNKCNKSNKIVIKFLEPPPSKYDNMSPEQLKKGSLHYK